MNPQLPSSTMPSLYEFSRVCAGCMLGQGRHCKCRAATRAVAQAATTVHQPPAQPLWLSHMLTKVLGWPSPPA
jgi:hypothetical protein